MKKTNPEKWTQEEIDEAKKYAEKMDALFRSWDPVGYGLRRPETSDADNGSSTRAEEAADQERDCPVSE